MKTIETATANPGIVLREEFDDWAVLFDPDSGSTFGLNPVSVYIWKHLDGKNTVGDIVKALREDCSDVPEDAADHIRRFICELSERGMVEIKNAGG